LKNRIFCLLVALFLVVSSSAMADTFDFSIVGNFGGPTCLSKGGCVTGTFTGNLVAPGEYGITSGTIDLIDLYDGNQPVSGNGILIQNPNPPNVSTSPNGYFQYDDLLFVASNPPNQPDIYGLLFDVGGELLNLRGNNSYYCTFSVGGHPGNLNGDLTVSPAAPTPEPASLILLGTSLLVLAGLLQKRLI